ncbi:MAG TPA: hypothetical protein VMS93_09835 [Candidatus Saccharimonadales bacterium]|nr:hypothetical protein [Candidatus Saccharimonadales bacterium]
MTPARMLLCVTLAALLIPVVAFGQTGVPIDHYKVYNLPPSTVTSGMVVTLQDQFGTEDMTILTLDRFANPVDKNSEGISNPVLHYSWWRLGSLATAQYPVREVVLSNQFGSGQVIKVQKPIWLLAPALKNVPPPPFSQQIPVANHYKCYEAITTPVLGKVVSLVDQFGARQAYVDSVKCFCNPVSKYVAGAAFPMVDPTAHLTCYSIKPAQFYGIPVSIEDQFRYTQIDVLDDCLLCVPSTKDFTTPAKPSTWGQLKRLYQ